MCVRPTEWFFSSHGYHQLPEGEVGNITLLQSQPDPHLPLRNVRNHPPPLRCISLTPSLTGTSHITTEVVFLAPRGGGLTTSQLHATPPLFFASRPHVPNGPEPQWPPPLSPLFPPAALCAQHAIPCDGFHLSSGYTTTPEVELWSIGHHSEENAIENPYSSFSEKMYSPFPSFFKEFLS